MFSEKLPTSTRSYNDERGEKGALAHFFFSASNGIKLRIHFLPVLPR